MRILDSTRPLSPFHLYRAFIDMQVNIFGSASGTACLAEMPDASVAEIDRRTASDREFGLARYGLTLDQYRPHIERARERGYGSRGPLFIGNTTLDDGLAAIALPVHSAGRICGAISLLWPKVYMKTEDFARDHLEQLRRTTRAISEDLDRLAPSGPGRVRTGQGETRPAALP